MATIDIRHNGSDLFAFMSVSDFAEVSHNAHHVTFTGSLDETITLIGDFTYDHGELSGGTVTGMQMLLEGQHYADVNGLFNDAVDMANLITAGDASLLTLSFGASTWNGSIGPDKITAGVLDDTLNGGRGDDILIGSQGGDALFGGSGSDTANYENAARGVRASLADPSVNTHDARGDTYDSIENLTGSAFDDKLIGNSHGNVLTGGDGDDNLMGGAGLDTLYGGNGADLLTGGLGQDTMYGGPNADTFRWTSASQAAAALGNADEIGDWGGTDLIAVSAAGFGGGLVAGQALTASQFHVDSAPVGTNGQFLYNTFADALLWDDDGTGPDSSVVVVHFLTNENLSSSDIIVF